MISKYSTQSLNIRKEIYMYIHVRVYLLHAYIYVLFHFIQTKHKLFIT